MLGVMLAAILSLVPVLAAAPQDRAAKAAFDERLTAIVPGETELAWRSVPWRAEFRAALVEADEQDKPVVLWAMNGHPLGQT